MGSGDAKLRTPWSLLSSPTVDHGALSVHCLLTAILPIPGEAALEIRTNATAQVGSSH